MHPQQPSFKLTRQAILLSIISAAYPIAGYAAIAGRTDFVVGTVEAIAADGSRRPLVKGSEVNAGDSINTAAGARAQVRFNDGGYVSLQPNTVFRVDQFNYQNQTDGNEKGFFSLLKGGLRAITGAIGHVNRETYKVATPNATIGIRGTGYKAEIRDDGLFVSVGEGAISLTNNVGLLVVTAGNAAFVANPNTPPTPTTEQPKLPPAGIGTVSSPVAVIQPILPSLASGSGYTLAYAFLNRANSTGGYTVAPLAAISAMFNSTSQLTSYSAGTESGSLGTAGVTFSATDGIIGWGRWDGNTVASGQSPMNPGLTPGTLHYVIGIPTAVLPTGSATYNLMGYTTPTATDGSTGYSVTAGTLSVNFGALTVGLNMTVSNGPTNTYTITTPTPLSIVSGSSFIGNATAQNINTVCSGGCTTPISGFFAGANASRAGLTYSINSPAGPSLIQGAAVFAKQ